MTAAWVALGTAPVVAVVAIVGIVRAWRLIGEQEPSHLDCGCQRDARPEVGCMRCGLASCRRHREHECVSGTSSAATGRYVQLPHPTWDPERGEYVPNYDPPEEN